MSVPAHSQDLEERLERVERAVSQLDRETAVLELRLRPLEGIPATGLGPDRPMGSAVSWPGLPAAVEAAPPREPTAAPAATGSGAVTERHRPALSISDVVGGRVLAWIGGLSTVFGIVLFLAVAISRGWITPEARTALAGIVSAGLGAAGTWLHGKRGRTEASVALVGAGTAGLFATLVVAGNVYDLINPLVALGAAMLIGAIATVLAIRWAGIVIGALGLLGALVSPVLVGAPLDGATIAVVGLATGCAVWTVVRQRWGWLGVAALLAGAPQWGWWILNGQPAVVDVAVVVGFGALGVVAAVGMPARRGTERVAVSPLLIAALNVCLVGPLGWLALHRVTTDLAGDLWLATLAAAHLVLGVHHFRRPVISEHLRRLLITIGVILGDAAFGLSTSGIMLAIGWGVAAIGFAWLTRRTLAQEDDNFLLGLGVCAHVTLTLIRVLLIAGPTTLAGGGPQLLPVLAVAVLAASCLACGQLVSSARARLDVVFNALGLAAVAYLTSQALSGSALVGAWAFEAATLAQLARRTDDEVAYYGGLAFLGLAAIHGLLIEAPPSALLTGVTSLGQAAVALGAIALACLRAGQTRAEGSRARRWLLAGAAGSLWYLASVAIITAFQPVGGGYENTLLDLSVRQEGQVLLSAGWSLTGLIGLILGLRRNNAVLRNGALGLLLLTVAKVFLYDLSTLTSLYRVISFVALGLLLLAGAFAYQRLRPPPTPDMRAVHPSQR